MDLTRKNKLLIGLVAVALILLGKIFYIQIIDDSYKTSAENNSMVYDIIYPTRGVIYDRNGKIIVGNKVAYDILVTPREVQAFDTLMLAEVLDTSVTFIRDKMAEYERNRRRIGFQSMTMLRQIPTETYNRFAEVQYQFPGFKGQIRSIRDYPVNAGGNLLGYVSEVDAGKRTCAASKAITSTCVTPTTRSSSPTRTAKWTRKPFRDTTSSRPSTRTSSNTARN